MQPAENVFTLRTSSRDSSGFIKELLETIY